MNLIQKSLPQQPPLDISFYEMPVILTCSLAIGELAYVLPQADLPLAVFLTPMVSDLGLFAWLSPGEVVQVLDGPCHDRCMTWWYARSLASNILGWVSAGNPEEDFILPVPHRQLCERALPSRLQIGDIAGITGPYPRPTSLLDRPIPLNQGGRPVGTIFGSSRITITNGPACYSDASSGQTFWQVELETGAEGWVAECDHDTYWLRPLMIAQDITLSLAL